VPTTFRWVATVTDLLAETGMVNGEVAVVEGFAAAGDGGGGTFRFLTSIPSDATISNVSAAGTVTVTTSAAHTLLTGQRIRIGGVTGGAGMNAVNAAWTITKATDTTFTLDGASITASYTSGGVVGNYGMTLPGNATTTGIWTRLRNSDANALDVRCFGAKSGGSAGDADPIQFAIHEFIAHPESYAYVFIPTGLWKLSKGLIIGRADGFFVRCILRGGDVVGPLGSLDFPYFGGAVLSFDDGSAASKETFVLAVQAANGVSITGVSLAGANHAPSTISTEFSDYRNLFLKELPDYIGSGVATARFSPHALLPIDPFDRNLPSADTTIAAGSNGQVLPPASPITLHVASTTGFSTAGGTILVTNNAGVESAMTYTGIGSSTTFTGCSGGSGTLATGGAVTNGTRAATTIGLASDGVDFSLNPATIWVASTSDFAATGTLHVATNGTTQTVTYSAKTSLRTTIATSSDGQTLTAGCTINVASTSGFPGSGTLLVATSAGLQWVTYTGTSGGNQFTTCNGGTGTVAIGYPVTQASFTGLSTGHSGVMSAGGAVTGSAKLYPGWESWYAASVAKSISVQLLYCQGRDGYIGTAVSPAGFGNGESIVLRSCTFHWCTIAHAYGQSQTRGCVLDDPHGWSWCYVGVDTFSIGQGNGTPPQITGGNIGGGCKYLFNVGANNQALRVSGLYCEATMSIGRVGWGQNAMGAKLSACTFLLMSTASTGKPDSVKLADAPFHLISSGNVDFDECLIVNLEDWCLRFDNRYGVLTFRNTRMPAKLASSKVPAGFHSVDNTSGTNQPKVVLERIMVVDGSGLPVVQEHPEWSRFSIEALKGQVNWTLTRVDAATATVAASDTTNLALGDVVGFLGGGSGAQWSPQFMDPAPGSSLVPWGVITSITANTSITLALLGKGVPFSGLTTTLQRFRWLGTATDGAVVGPGALYTRGTVSSIPNVGDAVYLSAADTVKQAKANSTSTMPAIGIVTSLADNGTKCRVAMLGQAGELQNTLSGLTAGAAYYVSAADAGKLVTTAPSSVGEIVQAVGVARSTTTLDSSGTTDFVIL
jgi:hypothetical protein